MQEMPVPLRPVVALVASLLGLTLTLAGCGESAGPSGAGRSAGETTGSFPVTVPHAFGETTVDTVPQRVVTWGWGSTDAAIALGVVPVAMPAQSYGGDKDKILPWVREALEKQGKPLPTVLPDVQEAPVEAIAAANPDVILAPYSGLTQSEYDLLSKIAPTVAYPKQPWATPWRETIEIVGTSLGRKDQADQLLKDIDGQVANQADAHPELAGKTVAVTFPTADAFYVYKPADARVGFILDLGMTSASSVEKLASGDDSFFYTLSTERLSELTSDVLVVYAATREEADRFLKSPGARLMQQVKNDAVAVVTGPERIAAVSPPTALSLTWGLQDYATELAQAARAAGRA
jgi:iron complex transport system substrate-binding protein